MGASCYKASKDSDRNSPEANVSEPESRFGAITNDPKSSQIPALIKGAASDYFDSTKEYPGSHDTYLGRDKKNGATVLLTHFDIKTAMTARQKTALFALLKYKATGSEATGAVCCVNFDRAFYGGSRLSLVSSFHDGKTVAEAIAEAGDKYDEAQALTWLAEIAQGILDLHKKGLVQGSLDINALRVYKLTPTSDGLQVPYFGLDQLGAATRPEQQWAGAIAPEMLLGETTQFSQATDIWNLGVILHTLLVGEPPLNADIQETKNIIKQRRQENEGKVHMATIAGWHLIQQDTQALVQDLLHLDPAKRLTAEQLNNELEHLLRQQFPGQGECIRPRSHDEDEDVK